MKGLSFTILILLVALGSGCLDEPDCVSPTTNFANVKFYLSEDNTEDKINIDSIVTIGSDSLLVKEQDDVTTVKLPLKRDASSSQFLFYTEEYGLKTLTLTYQINQRLISEDCGVEIIITDLTYSESTFDSIQVVNNILIEDINEDIRIYN